MTGHRISRRTVLRGLGTAAALPWLSAMARPATAAPQSDPLRMLFLYVPNGVRMQAWRPGHEGTLTELPPILKPLEPYREYVTVLSELTLNGARPLGDGPGDHARAAAAFLTGAHPKKTGGADIHNGVSVDQVAAESLGKETRFPSLELGVDPSAQAGACDSGYSCVYSSTLSWRSPTSPLAKETNPRAIFNRLFGDARSREAGDQRLVAQRKSILDFLADDATSLRRELGPGDRRKLDEYFYAVRQVEQRLERVEKENRLFAAGLEPPPEVSRRAFSDRLKLLMDMMVLALQTDSTRVITCMFANEGSIRSYPEVGAAEGHHSLSHHEKNPAKLDLLEKIDTFHVEHVRYFLDKLYATEEGGGRLLDHCLIVYGSGISDGNRHNHDDLPILLMGRGGGHRGARHRIYPKETPLANLYLALLNLAGIAETKFADSTGPLEGLLG